MGHLDLIVGKNDTIDRYMHTPRRILDKHLDRIELKRQRDREDHRADMKALIKRLLLIEKYIAKLADMEAEALLSLETSPDGDKHTR